MREDEGERRRWHARAKERGRETKRDAIDSGRVEFFFFFFFVQRCFFHFLNSRKHFFLSFSKGTLSFLSPITRWLRAPGIRTPRSARASQQKGPERREKKAFQKELSFFSRLSDSSEPPLDRCGASASAALPGRCSH